MLHHLPLIRACTARVIAILIRIRTAFLPREGAHRDRRRHRTVSLDVEASLENRIASNPSSNKRFALRSSSTPLHSRVCMHAPLHTSQIRGRVAGCAAHQSPSAPPPRPFVQHERRGTARHGWQGTAVCIHTPSSQEDGKRAGGRRSRARAEPIWEKRRGGKESRRYGTSL